MGGKLFYAVEHADLSSLASTRGFTFNGGLIAAGLLIGGYLWRTRLSVSYLDAVALGLPLGVAIGRIGDVINGEHYGPRSDFFLAVRNTHPDADTPNAALAYHSGGLYELLLASLIFGLLWSLRNRFRRPTALAWSVLALFAVGRFLVFFLRSDGTGETFGLVGAQWTSIVLLAVATVGATMTVRRPDSVRRLRPSAR